MNLTLSDSLLGRQRRHQWTPLITQQFRLRHIEQILGLNFTRLANHYYFTLHRTSMSAPFYTSDTISGGGGTKWPEMDHKQQGLCDNTSITSLVVRVWKKEFESVDTVVTTWGVYLSGLIYLGNKMADLQPSYFKQHTVIFLMRGGFFTGSAAILALDNLEGVDTEKGKTPIVKANKNDVKASYSVDKLRRLQSLQLTIKNRSLDVEMVMREIDQSVIASEKGQDDKEDGGEEEERNKVNTSNVKYASQLLTMKSVNKMFHKDKPTRKQRHKMELLKRDIEKASFKTKMLSLERDKKWGQIRLLKSTINHLIDKNDLKNTELMENYHCLSKEREKFRHLIRAISNHKELYASMTQQLNHRQKQLLHQLAFIYPIEKVNDKKFTIHGIYLPNSDILSDCSDFGMSVALGYVTHVLIMAASFLNAPLRYPMIHYGSRSYVTDHISPNLTVDKDRDFPLFTKGKERIHFTYAVYLLNKNIAQLRWLCNNCNTPELKATLPNLLSLLMLENGKVSGGKEDGFIVATASSSPPDCDFVTEPVIYSSKKQSVCRKKAIGLGEILAIPEAFMNQQISKDSFRNFATRPRFDQIDVKKGSVESRLSGDVDNGGGGVVEQGTDILDPKSNFNVLEFSQECSSNSRQQIINTNVIISKLTSQNIQTDDVKKVQQLLCHEEPHVDTDKPPMDDNDQVQSPLTARTDALLQVKSFNLVKPKNN